MINMKKTIIFHMGMYKTGSSALQAFLVDNRQKLLAEGIFYPEPRNISLENEFRLGSGNADHLCKPAMRYPKPADIDEIFTLLEQYDTVLYSGEHLFILENKQKFFNEFLSKGIEVKVIIYLRRQDKYLESLINQVIKTFKFKFDSLQSLDNSIVSQFMILDYFAFLEDINKVIDKNNIYVRLYEKQQLTGGTIYDDFLSVLNLKLTVEYSIPQSVINPSLSENYLKIKEILNELPIENHEITSIFKEPLIKMSVYQSGEVTYPVFFNPKERRKILLKYSKCNKLVAMKYLNRKNGRLFYDRKKCFNFKMYHQANYKSDDIIKLFGYLFYKQTVKIKELEREIEKLK